MQERAAWGAIKGMGQGLGLAFYYKALDFWNVVNLATNGLLVSAFVLRVMGLLTSDRTKSAHLHLTSFQILACVSPLIW